VRWGEVSYVRDKALRLAMLRLSTRRELTKLGLDLLGGLLDSDVHVVVAQTDPAVSGTRRARVLQGAKAG